MDWIGRTRANVDVQLQSAQNSKGIQTLLDVSSALFAEGGGQEGRGHDGC